jgi:anti-anti-sigma regulatory factor
MTCRIERVLTPDGLVVVRVSGRIDATDIEVLEELMENETTRKGELALDLTDVTLVSLDAVRALGRAEANGVELRNCPGYVREWISRERELGLPE